MTSEQINGNQDKLEQYIERGYQILKLREELELQRLHLQNDYGLSPITIKILEQIYETPDPMHHE